ncbi:tryptophan-rich antigen [Plasmodium ovale wallikeri]|uniref:Tryptophan-rich antigen n=2 Tax=Plasmodium ovale TaxID=36330 RepID=A0A1A9AT75_PLAOA|nr:tryptophan-rich antigen [Plasmodium ovale wallikeri]SBT59362.1 tryptophan-rich antigen [Plasmodium ovale wallikeri]SBT72503.1 tryptophan-rich protein [Plasmodium ovale]
MNILYSFNKQSLCAASFVLIISVLLFVNQTESVVVKHVGQNDQDNINNSLLENGIIIEKNDHSAQIQWNNWMMNLRVDWKYFKLSMEYEKEKWLDEKEWELQQFMEAMEDNWMHYNEHIDRQYDTDILEKCVTLNETQWEEWIKTEAKQFIEKDFKVWIDQIHLQLYDTIMKEFVQWKNNKIKNWLMTYWNCNEDEYLANWEYMSLAKLLFITENKYWITGEKEQLMKWLQNREAAYKNSEWNQLSEWKNDKILLFNDWLKSFINKWVSGKQWKVWVEERKNSILQKKCLKNE